MPTTHNNARGHRLLVLAGCVLVVPVALSAGYDFGNRLNGPLLGVATAANTALLGALLVDMAVDLAVHKLLPLLQRGATLRRHH